MSPVTLVLHLSERECTFKNTVTILTPCHNSL